MTAGFAATLFCMAAVHGSDQGEGWYFNVVTRKVEHRDRSKGSDLLGPYPDEATASRALEIADERTQKADAEDAAWEG